ncbi:site-2 protease family protein [Candidatus Parcubacteria bacterium]|nr:site-2 protease family protein [Candidatus Parcubacteria bacterium]
MIPPLAHFALVYIIIVFSAVVHEYAHAWTADRLGDSTAKDAGRLTLNPLKHLDLFGTVLMPFISLILANIFIGWAKPVPIDTRALRGRYAELFVAAAGPAANVLLAVLLGLAIRFISPGQLAAAGLGEVGGAVALFALALASYINIFIALFNLIPIAPLDGSHILPRFLPPAAEEFLSRSLVGMLIAIFLAMAIIPSLATTIFSLITGGVGQYGGSGA